MRKKKYEKEREKEKKNGEERRLRKKVKNIQSEIRNILDMNEWMSEWMIPRTREWFITKRQKEWEW